jgi:AcrR family transcriptional regulator
MRAGITKERLARAGAELADEVGFDRVTITEVARRFDVKVASLYSHVTGSDDLRPRIALLALEEMADRGDAALAEPDRTHAVRLLGSVFRGYVDLELGGAFSHSEPDSESSWRRSLDALDALLRSWPTTERP